MRASFTSGYTAPLPEGHIFPMKKFEGLYRYLLDRRVISKKDIVQPRPAERNHLLLAHTPYYVDAILRGTLTRKEERRMGLKWSPELATRSRLAVQGTINASIMALEDGLAANIAGGTHHGMPNHGEGFCVFNDVAVAIRVLQQSMWARRVLIIDCDVHQGNGNAYMFSNNEEVFTFSIHGAKNYPFRKPASTLDIGLPDGTGDQQYLDTLERSLNTVFNNFEPDLVFYLGGIDPLETDHFGRLSLTHEGLHEREQLVLESVMKRELPLVLLMAGGYAPTVDDTVMAHSIMYEKAVNLWN